MARNFMPLMAAVLLLLVVAVADASGRPVAGDPCSTTDFPVLCKSVVKGVKKPSAATAAAIKALLPLTQKAKAKAKKGKDDTCFSNFDSAIDNLQKSLKNIKENDGFSLNINLSAALTDFETCIDALEEGSPSSSDPIAKSARLLRQMADNCLSLSTLLPH
ncbi:PREDICTED: uncharacterized protein LOC104822159 [Tarenaya hassleriana]|uniref:uncharacterized protein LOC104822159 n=1 Tax=Tarenaya hassleriana TaxID=28532 RepID=UPI00053C827A|nr:PREDICTED: uncharacterized protein LOC104822159 [Tarenaya hassleriana]